MIITLELIEIEKQNIFHPKKDKKILKLHTFKYLWSKYLFKPATNNIFEVFAFPSSVVPLFRFFFSTSPIRLTSIVII